MNELEKLCPIWLQDKKIVAQKCLFVIKLLLSNLETMNMWFLLGTELRHKL